MTYDRGPLTVFERDGAPIENRLRLLSRHYYARIEVYHRRFWESVQAGDRVDEMVQIPFGDELHADLYAELDDGLIYRVNQAQPGEDDDGLPCCRLSLHREEQNYELVRSGNGAEGCGSCAHGSSCKADEISTCPRFWFGTRAEYNALPALDPRICYCIEEGT